MPPQQIHARRPVGRICTIDPRFQMLLYNALRAWSSWRPRRLLPCISPSSRRTFFFAARTLIPHPTTGLPVKLMSLTLLSVISCSISLPMQGTTLIAPGGSPVFVKSSATEGRSGAHWMMASVRQCYGRYGRTEFVGDQV